jgi:hypothetical protein
MAMAQATIENEVAAQKLQAPQAPVNGAIKTETEDEYDARMEALRLASEEAEKKAQEEANRTKVQRAKGRVAGILERERVRNPRNEQPLTPTRIKSIQDGIRFMGSVCDGAVARDNQGFNKPDAYTGHTLSVAGLQDEDELRAAEYMLMRYPRQWTLVG